MALISWFSARKKWCLVFSLSVSIINIMMTLSVHLIHSKSSVLDPHFQTVVNVENEAQIVKCSLDCAEKGVEVILTQKTKPPTPDNSGGLTVESELKKKFASLQQPVINHLHYSYPINVANACEQRNVEVLMPVHSAVTNFKRRDNFRGGDQTKFANQTSNNALYLFFVALPSGKVENVTQVQSALREESDKYGDIVQMNITDTYRNLTLKALGVYNWILTYCARSTVVLKFDDDVKTQPSTLLKPIYDHMMNESDFMIGETIYKANIDRRPKSRWYVSKNEFPGKKFPSYATGHAIGHPTSTVRLLYLQGLRTKLNSVDDVFISGICREKLGIPIIQHPDYHKKKTVMALKAEKFVVS